MGPRPEGAKRGEKYQPRSRVTLSRGPGEQLQGAEGPPEHTDARERKAKRIGDLAPRAEMQGTCVKGGLKASIVPNQKKMTSKKRNQATNGRRGKRKGNQKVQRGGGITQIVALPA